MNGIRVLQNKMLYFLLCLIKTMIDFPNSMRILNVHMDKKGEKH